ncbi:hypothetical protein IAR50_005925 [Cryptococcus sp. DSM 104548]
MLPPNDPPSVREPVQSAHASSSNAIQSASSRDINQPSSAPHPSSSHTSADDHTFAIYTQPLYIDGIYEGKLMKFALTVEQEPLFGRRKTEKDRRPLGPAPIIRLRAVECHDAPGSADSDTNDVEADPVDYYHLICAAEILPPSDQTTTGKRVSPVVPKTSIRPGKKSGKAEKRRRQEMDSDEDATPVPDANAHTGDLDPVAERNLFGSLYVSAVRVPDLLGDMATWFMFTDLCVRQEGCYSLRFRCFDVSAITGPGSKPVPHLAECRSQPFNIYPPRQMPGLPKPTELAEHFANQGFKLNSRKNDKPANLSPPPPSRPTTSSGQTKPSTRLTQNGPARPQSHPVQHRESRDASSSTAASQSRSGSTVPTVSSSAGGVREGTSM